MPSPREQDAKLRAVFEDHASRDAGSERTMGVAGLSRALLAMGAPVNNGEVGTARDEK